MNSWIHELSRYMKIRWCNMKAYLHAFVLQLSRYMKIRWHNIKDTFINLHCNYQGTWKSSVSRIHHQISLHLKFILKHSAPCVLWTWVWMGSCVTNLTTRWQCTWKLRHFRTKYIHHFSCTLCYKFQLVYLCLVCSTSWHNFECFFKFSLNLGLT